jgi:hypothetical protein
MTRFSWIAIVALAVLPAGVQAQHPGYGQNGGYGPNGDPPPIDPTPPGQPVGPPYCSYSIRPIGPIPRIDYQHSGDDLAHASANGCVYVGEADVDQNSLAAGAASSLGWMMHHHAIGYGPAPCLPVMFSDSVRLRARVETKLTGSSGARHAQIGGSAFLSSSALPPTAAAVVAANNDTGQTVSLTLLLPVPSPTGMGVVPVPFSVASPASNTTCADEKEVRALGSKTIELNLVVGHSSLQIAAGSVGFLSGGGKARVVWSGVEYVSESSCATHGVSLGFPGYASEWKSTYPF